MKVNKEALWSFAHKRDGISCHPSQITYTDLNNTIKALPHKILQIPPGHVVFCNMWPLFNEPLDSRVFKVSQKNLSCIGVDFFKFVVKQA